MCCRDANTCFDAFYNLFMDVQNRFFVLFLRVFGIVWNVRLLNVRASLFLLFSLFPDSSAPFILHPSTRKPQSFPPFHITCHPASLLCSLPCPAIIGPTWIWSFCVLDFGCLPAPYCITLLVLDCSCLFKSLSRTTSDVCICVLPLCSCYPACTMTIKYSLQIWGRSSWKHDNLIKYEALL